MFANLPVFLTSHAVSGTGGVVMLAIVAVIAVVVLYFGVDSLEDNYCISIVLPGKAKPLFKLHPTLILSVTAALVIYCFGLSLPAWTIVWLTVQACVSGLFFLDAV